MKKYFILYLLLMFAGLLNAQTIYVSPSGNDDNPGTRDKPLATFDGAKKFVLSLKKSDEQKITVIFLRGTYYLHKPLVFKPEDSGMHNVNIVYKAEDDQLVTISGGLKLNCEWEKYEDGIYECKLPDIQKKGFNFAQLYVNGKRQTRARYPNYDNSIPGITGYVWPEGTIPSNVEDPNPLPGDFTTYNNQIPRGIVYNPKTFTKNKWSKLKGAIIHIFQAQHWQILQWTVKAVDYKHHYIWFGKGGNQLGAKWTGSPIQLNNQSQFFIDNIFQELDAPGEWYWDQKKGILYYKPTAGVNISKAIFEIPVFEKPIQFLGSQYRPVHNIVLNGFRITDTKSTFMDKYSVPSKSDWAIHRGGAIFFQGAVSVSIKNCWLDEVGGNAVFFNNYNCNDTVTGCKITGAGESAICFVGNFELTNGTYKAFPYECTASNNLIHNCGYFGKQVAGVYISRAKRITASHNLIYDMPRAGICIGDGTWGGDIIEFNDMYDCVQQTWDHGPFNSWGREGYWSLTHSHSESTFTYPFPAGKVKTWAMETNIIRNNYIHGLQGYNGGYYQGLDLDDGSSNFHVYNNVCVGMGISIREGDFRTVENNIIINPVVPFGAHVGHPGNHDVIRHNIIVTDGSLYYVNDCPAKDPIISKIDSNDFYNPKPGWGNRTVITVRRRGEDTQKYTFSQWQKLGYDKHSIDANPMFYDLKSRDFRVKPGSPALKIGFKNFKMDWGLTNNFPEMWREK